MVITNSIDLLSVVDLICWRGSQLLILILQFLYSTFQSTDSFGLSLVPSLVGLEDLVQALAT